MDSVARLQQILKAAGQSMTTQRQSVFQALLNREAIAMHELVACCTNVDRASVYRAVALFEKLGVVQRLQTGWKYKLELADEFHGHHHHATCLLCGHSLVVPEDPTIEQRLRNLAAKIGFQLERHQLELQGYCTDCRELLKD